MPGTNQTSSENLSCIISDILHLQTAPGKRQLESNKAFPEIWVKNVSDQGEEEVPEEDTIGTVQSDESNFEEEPDSEEVAIATFIAKWIYDVQINGFSPMTTAKYLNESIDCETEEDDTSWESDLVRVFLPYYDLGKDDIDQVVNGRVAANGEPLGKCTVRLTNGDEVTGSFRPNFCLSGIAGAAGSNMERHGLLSVRGFHCQGLLHGRGRAVLTSKAIWSSVNLPVTLEGIFNESYMEGPVRGTDENGNLIFMGSFSKGVPSGYCWLAQEGQGWLYGQVDDHGQFSGNEIAYIYPNLSTALLGTFHKDQLVEARACHITAAFIENDLLRVSFSQPEPDAPAYTFSPSTVKSIPCDWVLEDAYEQVTVLCKESKIEGAGDGLFAKRDLPAETVIAYYNGLHINPEDDYSPSSYNYQIYVDWTNTEGSPYVDIPSECVDFSNYSASLAHKANHSFTPNCRFVSVHHPRFGRIPALKTLVSVKRGEELFSHYKYDTAYAPRWYVEMWQRSNPE